MDKPEQAAPTPKPSGMTGVRKRQQIQNTNKNIFVWLSVASVIVSICLVALQFLVREVMFNQDIISQKSKTNKTLIANISAAEELRKNVNALLANSNLNSLKYEAKYTETSALNVVLDALPVGGDATEIATSLQALVLPSSGVGLRELSTASLEAIDGTTEFASTGATQPQQLPFAASFEGNYTDAQKALTNMALVIRPINLTSLELRVLEKDKLQISIDGVTYYLPARSVEVREEKLKPRSAVTTEANKEGAAS